MTSRIEILLWTRADARRARWREMLAATDARIRDNPAAVEDPASVEVVVVDQTADEPEARQRLETLLKAAAPGVVAVDCDSPADVSLPADASPRELRLACRLLSEIVRLRRKQDDNQRARRALEELAHSDHLTGLPNRRAWDQALAGWSDGVVALLDLDHFKRINDRLGHARGDQILREVAGQLRANVRDDDFVARLGGDEFGLLLARLTAATAATVVERIRRSVARRCSGELEVTASVGFANANQADAASWLASADMALRQAKAAGRDRAREA